MTLESTLGPWQDERLPDRESKMRAQIRRLVWTCAALSLAACGGDDDSGGEPGGEPDAVVESTFTCNTAQRVAEVSNPPESYPCAGAPEYVTIDDQGHVFDIFTYEASHPLGTADLAFPCAGHIKTNDDGTQERVDVRAPAVSTEACSVAGSRPWHTVEWDDAKAACEAIGWRLCTGDELLRGCQGDAGFAFTYGNTIEANRCNIRGAFYADGETASEAPTGHFDTCVSPDGLYDVNGNVWEWTADRLENDARARVYQGAGWKTIAQRHQDSEQTCEVQTRVTGFSAPSFASENVGFRCCRDAD